MSYQDKLKQQLDANSQYNSNQGGDWFKFKEGDNTFRVLSEPVMFFEKFKMGVCYTDCGYQGSPKLLTHILDRADGKVKLAKIPYTKGEELAALENDADYGFTGFPMPYDVTIKAIGAGTKEVNYSAPLPRPVKELPVEMVDQIKKLKTCEEIIEKMKAKQKEKHIQDGTFKEPKRLTREELNASGKPVDKDYEYPEEEINPEDIPF